MRLDLDCLSFPESDDLDFGSTRNRESSVYPQGLKLGLSKRIDLDALLRRSKSEKWRRQLRPRPIDALIAAAPLIDQALLRHCSVCLGEITAGIGHYESSRQFPTAAS